MQNVPLSPPMPASLPSAHGINPHTLLEWTAQMFGLQQSDLIGPSRTAYVVRARQAAAYALRVRFQQLSLADIGALLGGRHHSTISHALHAVSRHMQDDATYFAQVAALIDQRARKR